MAIPKNIQKIDDIFDTAYKLLTPNDRMPANLLSSLKNKMNMFADTELSSTDVKKAFDRNHFKNRNIYGRSYVAGFNSTSNEIAPAIGQNFVNSKGEYFIFEKLATDSAGQNVYQFRSPVGTIEEVVGDRYSSVLSKVDNKYNLDDAKAYGDDMYELYVQKQIYDRTNMADKKQYYEDNVKPVVEKLKNKINDTSIDVYPDKEGRNLLDWGYNAQNWSGPGSREAQRQQQRQYEIHNQQQRQRQQQNELDEEARQAEERRRQQQEQSQQQAERTEREQAQERAEQQRQVEQQEEINQRNIEKDGSVNVDQAVDKHGETPSETVDKHNSNAPDPNTSTQTVNSNANDWRQKIKDQQRSQRGVNTINIDDATAKVKIDTSDPFNIYKTTTDAAGNTRTQHWTRKNEWGGDADLVSDVSYNQYGSYDNITKTYTGQDRSPIDWINADEWNDDYILGRAGDDEDLLNSMMNARERKIQEQQRRAATGNGDTVAHAEETAQASSSTGPKAFDPDDPTTWTDADIANMADGNPDLYQELINQRSQATGGNTTGNGPDIESNNVPDYEPEIDPMENPLNWTDDYIEEISEGDPAYYEQLNRQRQQAIYADKYKNVDPSNPTSWTDDYIKDTALNKEEFDWMTDKMRQAKNLDIVDELNKQRRSQPELNRQQRRQQQKDNRQKGNQQEKKTKKQKENDRRRRKFEDRQRAMGNDPDEQRRINREANEQRRQQQQNSEPKVNKGNQQSKKKKNQNNYDIPDEADDALDDALDAADDAVDAAKGANAVDDAVEGAAKFGKLDMIMSAVNVLGAVGDYKAERRKGRGVIASAVTAGAKFAVFEALGAWALPVQLVSALPGMAIKGADMLYKENRRMNSSANFQVFGDAQFMDTQQLATMRQSGMEMAKMAQYNLQQTLMGNEATYLHR